MRSTIVILATVLLFLLKSRSAFAQKYVVAGTAELASGAEGGGDGASVVRRARTAMRLGGEVYVDESPKDIISAAGLVEMEPRVMVGADARYGHKLSERFSLNAGGIGYFLPRTLFGGTADATFRFPLGKETALQIAPTINAYFLGNDLPQGAVVFQALLRVGIYVKL